MALSKEQKAKAIEKLKDAVAKQKAIVFVNFSGLTAQDMGDLRKKLKEIGAKLIVAKKTLAKLVFKERKLELPEEAIENELAIIFGFEDELAPAKAAYDFSKTQESLKIAGGYMEDEFVGAENMLALAQLPSKNELFARLVGTLSAPIANFVNVQKANLKGLIYALEAIKNK